MSGRRALRQHRKCACGEQMMHRYSFDFVLGLYRAQVVCDRCGRRTAVYYSHSQSKAISDAYTAMRTYARVIE